MVNRGHTERGAHQDDSDGEKRNPTEIVWNFTLRMKFNTKSWVKIVQMTWIFFDFQIFQHKSSIDMLLRATLVDHYAKILFST